MRKIKKRKRRFPEYDYEEIYNKKILGEESLEDAIHRGKDMVRRIVVKTIQSGDILESEIYPVFLNLPERIEKKKKRTRQEQKNLNDRNSRKTFVRYVLTNFTERDLFLTLPYEDYYYPTYEQARKDMKNYIAKLRNYRKKNELSPLKAIYVVSFLEPGEKTKKVRMHHHIIINGMDRDTAERLWTKSDRANSKLLKPDDYGLTGVAKYIVGNPGRRRWGRTQNLKKPKETKSVTKLTRKRLNDLARDQAIHKEIFEQMYAKHRFLDSEIRYSDFVGSFYIYTRMRKVI